MMMMGDGAPLALLTGHKDPRLQQRLLHHIVGDLVPADVAADVARVPSAMSLLLHHSLLSEPQWTAPGRAADPRVAAIDALVARVHDLVQAPQVEARLAGLAFLGVLCQRASLQRFLAGCHSWAALLTATLNTARAPQVQLRGDSSRRGLTQGPKSQNKGAGASVGQEDSREPGEGSGREGAGAAEGGEGATEAERGRGRAEGDAGSAPGVSPGAHILCAAAFAALADLVTRLARAFPGASVQRKGPLGFLLDLWPCLAASFRGAGALAGLGDKGRGEHAPHPSAKESDAALSLTLALLTGFPSVLRQHIQEVEVLLVAVSSSPDLDPASASDRSLQLKCAEALARLPQVTRRAPEWNLFVRRLLLGLHAELDVVFRGLEDGKRKEGGRESLQASAEDTEGEGHRRETLRPFGEPSSQQLGALQGATGQGSAEFGGGRGGSGMGGGGGGGGGGDSPGFFQEGRWTRAASRAQCLVACCCKLLAAGFGAPVKVPIAALVSVCSRILHVDGAPPPAASSSSLTPAPTLFPSIASPGTPNPTQQSLLCSLLPDLHSSALHLLSALISSCQKQALPQGVRLCSLLTFAFRHGSAEAYFRTKLYQATRELTSALGIGAVTELGPVALGQAISDLRQAVPGPYKVSVASRRTPGGSMSLATPRTVLTPRGGVPPAYPGHHPALASPSAGVSWDAASSPSPPSSEGNESLQPALSAAILEMLEMLLTQGGALLPQAWRADLDNVLVSTAKAGMASALEGPLLTDPQGLSTHGAVLLAACRALLATALAPSDSHPQHPLLGPILDVFRTGQQLLGTPVASFCSGALMATLPLLHPRALAPPAADLDSPEAAGEGAAGRNAAGVPGGERVGPGAAPAPNPRLCGVPAPLPPSPLSRDPLQATAAPGGGGEKRGGEDRECWGGGRGAGAPAVGLGRRGGGGGGAKLPGAPLAQLLLQQQQQLQQESAKESTGSPGTPAAGLGATSAPAPGAPGAGQQGHRHGQGQAHSGMLVSAEAVALAAGRPQVSGLGVQPSVGILATSSVKVLPQPQPHSLGVPGGGVSLPSVPQGPPKLGPRPPGAVPVLNSNNMNNNDGTVSGYADFGLWISEKLDLANATMPLEVPAHQARGAPGSTPGAAAGGAGGGSAAGGGGSTPAGSLGGGEGAAGAGVGGGAAAALLSSASGKHKARPSSSGTPSASSKADLVFERTFAPAMAKFLVASSGHAGGSPSKAAGSPAGVGAGAGGRKAGGTPPAKGAGAGSRAKGKLSQSLSQPLPQPQTQSQPQAQSPSPSQGQRIVRKLSMPALGEAAGGPSQSQSQSQSQGQSQSPGGKSEGSALERGAWASSTGAGPGAGGGEGAGSNGKKRSRQRKVARTTEEAEMAASLAAAEMEESRRKALKITSGLASRQRAAAGASAQLPSGAPQGALSGVREEPAGNLGALGAQAVARGQGGGASEGDAGLQGGASMQGSGLHMFGGEEGLPILSPGAVMAAMASLNAAEEAARFDALDSDSDGPMPDIHLD